MYIVCIERKNSSRFGRANRIAVAVIMTSAPATEGFRVRIEEGAHGNTVFCFLSLSLSPSPVTPHTTYIIKSPVRLGLLLLA